MRAKSATLALPDCGFRREWYPVVGSLSTNLFKKGEKGKMGNYNLSLLSITGEILEVTIKQ